MSDDKITRHLIELAQKARDVTELRTHGEANSAGIKHMVQSVPIWPDNDPNEQWSLLMPKSARRFLTRLRPHYAVGVEVSNPAQGHARGAKLSKAVTGSIWYNTNIDYKTGWPRRQRGVEDMTAGCDAPPQGLRDLQQHVTVCTGPVAAFLTIGVRLRELGFEGRHFPEKCSLVSARSEAHDEHSYSTTALGSAEP